MSERNNERLLKIALEEVHGGKAPPDLTARILAAARGETLPDDTRRRPFLVRQRVRLFGIAAGALIALGTLALLREYAPRPALAIKVAVAEGSLSHTGRHKALTFSAGATRELALAIGDELRSAKRGATHLDLFSLGRLRLAEDTLLEVKDMKIEQTQLGGGFALGAVTVAVIGGAIWWTSGSTAVEAKGGESLEMRAGKQAIAAVSAEELARLRQIEGEHNTQVSGLQARLKELEERLARQPVPTTSRPEPENPVAKMAESDAEKTARFSYPGLDKALGDIDWKESGAALHKMSNLLADLQAAMGKGEEPSMDLIGQITSTNGQLIKLAGALAQNGVPGTGLNGSFTHPVVAANQLNAALTSAKIPLDQKQADSLSRLASQYAGTDDQRRAAFSADAPALRGVLEELDLKDRFFSEAKQLLTQEQRDLAFRSGTEDTLTGTLFSTGIVWQTLLMSQRPIEAKDGADYAGQLANEYGRKLELDEAGQQNLATLTQRWAAQMPKELFDPIQNGISGLKTSRVRTFAQQQVALTEEIASSMSLTPAQRKSLLKQTQLRLPAIRPKK